jgi:hypothetical protein
MQSESNFHTLVLRSEHDEITVGCFVEQYKTFLTFKHSAYQSMDETLYILPRAKDCWKFDADAA